MAKVPTFFIVHEERSKRKFRMSLAEVRAFVTTLSAAHRAQIKIQAEGRVECVPLDELPETSDLHPLDLENEDDETTVIALQTATNLGAEEIVTPKVPRRATERPASERRRSPRVTTRQKIIVVWEGSVYRTFTVDASLDGLRLEHPIPKQLIGRIVEGYLSSRDLQRGLFFKAELVSDDDLVRLRFKDQAPEHREILAQWLNLVTRQSA